MDMNCRNAADAAAATDDTADAPHRILQPDQGMATGHMPVTAAAALPAVSVAVFAYNEENLIEACLDSIAGCAGEADISVHVLVNGCTDRTEEIVRRRAAARPDVHPVIIRLGDKANAWNHYTHSVAQESAAMHCFIDGDMTIAKGSVAALLRAFADDPSANGCAALPMGRRREAYRRKLAHKREMSGNFYALRGTFLNGFRDRGIRLPVGMFGEDGLVTSLAKFGLDLGPFEEWRVTSCSGAQYHYASLSPFRLSDWRIFGFPLFGVMGPHA
jgi:cellulose synthase/poly-beta-1,6-N-acetylglucosamine synthase-like glycosyltransferase